MSEDPSAWLNRETTESEVIAPRHIEQFRATLGAALTPGGLLPGLHWCLMPDLAPPEALGRDGHPRPGIFMPELPLPRRMWAGGEVQFAGPALSLGERVSRRSRISAITPKQGSTGPLIFVTQTSDWTVGGEIRLIERRDLAYAPGTRPGQTAAPVPAEDWPDAQGFDLTPDPVLLFRYSAMTFNGHRIHYDPAYATGVEGYGGIVVHGPLQATLLLNLAANMLGGLPRLFRYRSLTPLICGLTVRVEGKVAPEGLSLRVRRADGVVTFQATAST